MVSFDYREGIYNFEYNLEVFKKSFRRRQNRDNENQQPAERPGVFRLMWTFVSRFITSLIPNNPAPVNAN